MTIDAQNEANRRNAQASTGPVTPEGKSTSSRNAVSHGLFSTSDTLNETERTQFKILAEAMNKDLAPDGILEQTLSSEITRAAWRLRRCAAVEDSLVEADPFTDAMAGATTCGTQKSVDRARLQTHRILNRTMAELRRLQNERRFRIEVLPDDLDTGGFGLASYKELIHSMVAEKRFQLMKRKLEGLDSMEKMLGIVTAPPTSKTSATKQTQSAPPVVPVAISRNSLCPCKSGQKYKRCCGKGAPPVLGMAA
jgi:hypothetical protein